ncbi:MAG: hypothetical protein Kow00105_06130 [Phycisphaeraceae bacterium]
MNSMRWWCAFIFSFSLSSATQADIITSFADLELVLTDQIIIEDFESVSLHGGGALALPNPFTAPAWGIEPGVTYSSPDKLTLYSGNVLAANKTYGPNLLTITFDQPQLAVGMDLIDFTGNLDYHETIRFYHDTVELGSLAVTLQQASSQFVGWQHPSGITHVTIQSDVWSIVDNVAWGLWIGDVLVGDLDRDEFVGISDLNLLLSNWNQSTPPVIPTADPSGDGYVGIEDLNMVLGNWNAPEGPQPPGQTVPEPITIVALEGGLILLSNRLIRPAHV